MSYAKNRKIKQRRREVKEHKHDNKLKADRTKKMYEEKVHEFMLNNALASEKKIKKTNQGLVEKFKRLLRIKV